VRVVLSDAELVQSLAGGDVGNLAGVAPPPRRGPLLRTSGPVNYSAWRSRQSLIQSPASRIWVFPPASPPSVGRLPRRWPGGAAGGFTPPEVEPVSDRLRWASADLTGPAVDAIRGNKVDRTEFVVIGPPPPFAQTARRVASTRRRGSPHDRSSCSVGGNAFAE
jgi:hypothetical protein